MKSGRPKSSLAVEILFPKELFADVPRGNRIDLNGGAGLVAMDPRDIFRLLDINYKLAA
jgi:hypothetical protein